MVDEELFQKVWKEGEKRYSSIIAQTLWLSNSFASFFWKRLVSAREDGGYAQLKQKNRVATAKT